MDQILMAALGAALIGFVVAWIAQNARFRLALAECEVRAREALSAESQRRATAEAHAARVPAMEAALTERDAALFDLKAALAAHEARLETERRSFEERLAAIEDARSKLSDAFKALSADALKSNNQAFLELARATLESFQQARRAILRRGRTRSISLFTRCANRCSGWT
jgi:DNA recombination protein RmuC